MMRAGGDCPITVGCGTEPIAGIAWISDLIRSASVGVAGL